MSKFKVGDMVIGIGVAGRILKKNVDGLHGTVKSVSVPFPPHVGVEWDIEIDGHCGNGCYSGKKNHCWNVDECNLRHLVAQKILITTDGVTTLARLYEGNKVVKSAAAKCAPSDTFDFAVGANLAYDRLMDRLPATPPKAEKPAQEPIKLYCVKEDKGWLTKGKVYTFDGHKVDYDNGHECFYASSFDDWKRGDMNLSSCLIPLIKRPAKVGEWVYVLHTSYSDDLVSGDIAKVIKADKRNGNIFITKDTDLYPDGLCFWPREYLVLDGFRG